MNIKLLMTDTLMKKWITLLSTATLLLVAVPAVQAQDAHQHHDAAAIPAPAEMSSGEVVKVDKETGKITLRHGPLTNLGMPGMTMAFRAGEPAMLDQVKPGDKVHSVAEKANGALMIMTMQSAN